MKKKFLIIVSLLLSSLFIFNVKALEVVEAGNVVDQSGEYDSSRVVAGNKVTSNATIDGISLVAGNDVKLQGKSAYGLYAGNTVTINEFIEKDLFVAGNDVKIGGDAIISRDAYITGNSVYISSNIARDLRVGANVVDISGITISGDAYIDANKIIMDEKTVIEGKLSYLEDTDIEGLNKASIGEKIARKNSQITIQYDLKEIVNGFLISAVAAFLTMVVLFYLIPKSKEKLDNTEISVGNILKLIGIGLLCLIVVPFVFVLALLTGILTPLAFMLLAIYLIGLYLSQVLTYYVVGNTLLKKAFNKDNYYLALLVGIVLVKLIKFIPIIRGWVALLGLLYGLGLIYKFIMSRGE